MSTREIQQNQNPNGGRDLGQISQQLTIEEIPTIEEFNERMELASSFKWHASAASYHAQGNPYQRHIAFFESEKARALLHQLGGLASAF